MRNKKFTEFVAVHTKTAGYGIMHIGKKAGQQKYRSLNRREMVILQTALLRLGCEVPGRSVPDQGGDGWKIKNPAVIAGKAGAVRG